MSVFALAAAALSLASAPTPAVALSLPALQRDAATSPACLPTAAPAPAFGSLLLRARCEVPPGGLPPLTPLPEAPKDTASKESKDVKDTKPASPAPTPAPQQPKTAETKSDSPSVPPPTPAPEPQKAADAKPAADPTPTPPPSAPTLEAGFKYYAPGALLPQDAARGRKDRHVYLPDMVFPLKLEAGQFPHMNSQIYGFGGGGWNGKGAAGGSECDPRNYDAMQQRDDYCEVRGHAMPMCPAGVGHQGQDIRPPTCKDKTWEAVAVVDGTIIFVSGFTTVRLKAKDGTTYEYLHMHPDTIKVKENQKVKQGDVLGRVSNIMNGKRDTTTHLHFQALQQRTVNGKLVVAYVPTFPSLIAALRRAKGQPAGIDANGDLEVDPRLEIGAVVAPKPAPEPPKPAPEPPKPAPEPPKPAPEPPKPAPEPPQPAPEPPKPAPEPPKPAPEPPKPAPEPPKPAPEPPKPAPEPPKPAPEPPKPAPEPPKPAPEPPKPAPEPPAPAPEPKAEAPKPAPVPAPDAPKSSAPASDQKGWWQWTKDKASAAKDLAGAAKDKVSDWWSSWRNKK